MGAVVVRGMEHNRNRQLWRGMKGFDETVQNSIIGAYLLATSRSVEELTKFALRPFRISSLPRN
jgi:hypothetical protein